jgi:prophage maintenance system killer protein
MTDHDVNEQKLAYHHPENPQYSLVHVTDDEDRHVQRVRDLEEEDELDIRTERDCVGDTDTHLIYATDAPGDPLAEFETEAEFVAWIRESFSQDDLQIVLAVYRAFRGVLEERSGTIDELTLYKQMELERIPDVVNRVEWRQPVPEVAADLLSAFILAHPMPNTNHRTGISLLDRYLTSIDSSFAMPDTGVDDEWYDWASGYIHDSKRLLTLRNRLSLFQYAAALGYETAERKEGIIINLTEIDFDTADSDIYERQHRERTRTFVETLLEQADATHLLSVEDNGKEAFVARLRADQ